MPKKQQKITKISQKNAILMSEKISVTPINKEFSQKYGVKVEYPLKQGLKHPHMVCLLAYYKVKVEYPLKQGLKPKGEIS